MSQIRKRTPSIGHDLPDCLKNAKIDKEYARFYLRCRTLVDAINDAYKTKLTPRQLDNLLLWHPPKT